VVTGTDWNFGGDFPIILGMEVIIPTDELTHKASFFRGVGGSTTNQMIKMGVPSGKLT